MRLRNERQCSHDPEACGVKRALVTRKDADITVWPIEYIPVRNKWRVYFIDRISNKGGHAHWKLCQVHHERMLADHERIGRDEVEVYNQTMRYYDRTEG